MATHNVSARYESEFGAVIISPSTLEYVEAGDTINFSGSGSYWSGFSSSYFTNTSSISSSGTKTIKSTVASGATTYVQCSISGKSATLRIDFLNKDEYPSSFGLSNVSNVDPKALIQPHVVTVSGINTDVKASISSSGGRKAHLYKGSTNSVPRTSVTVGSGDKLTLEVEAEHDYSQELTITLTVGTRTETFRVINRTYPLADQKISLGINSPPLYFVQDLVTFFGSQRTYPQLSDYLRGNGLVPSIAENAHVPTSLPLNMTDLLGTYSAMYFRFRPPTKAVTADTSTGGKSLGLTWDMVTDYDVGYGRYSKELEYKYVVTRADSYPSSEVSIYTPAHSNEAAWHQGNTYIQLSASSGANTEKMYRGTLTIYVRNAVDTSLVISQQVSWIIGFYGQ
jgi:hypothetical protein